MADEVAKGMSSADARSAAQRPDSFDASGEDGFWREQYGTRPYVLVDVAYEHYRPAYQYGWESARRNPGRSWDAAEPELRAGWNKMSGRSRSAWDEVKHAVRDAWERVVGRTDAGAKREVGKMGTRADQTDHR